MKKNILFLSIGIIILSTFFTIHDYFSYKKEINNFVNNVTIAVLNKYPELEDQMIDIINGKNYNEVLNNYGFIDETTILNTINENYKHNLILHTLITFVLVAIFVIIYLRKEINRKKEIDNIIEYLKDLNQGIYNLDIMDNEEGQISELKNEICKTTVILREKALQELDDKIKLKDSLSNISHQLKTPLTSILIMLDNIIDEDIDKSTQLEFLKDIRNQIENINFLIYSMLKLSRFDASVIVFKHEKIDVQKLINESIKNLDILRDLKNITIHTNGKNDTTFMGDYKWELEAITNIIKNAIEYTPNDKNIYIDYEQNSILTKITITDEGPGLSKKDINHIFERFYKGINSSSTSFGIGLSLAKEIINNDNGVIKAEKIKNGGTKFTIKYYN